MNFKIDIKYIEVFKLEISDFYFCLFLNKCLCALLLTYDFHSFFNNLLEVISHLKVSNSSGKV